MGLKEEMNEKIAELPLEEVLEMAKDPEAKLPVLEMAVEKIKDVQVPQELGGPPIDKEVMELPTEILLEMAKDPEANEEMLEAAVVRLEETIEEKVEKLPLNEVLEMAKDPEVEVPILEIAIEKIKDMQDLTDNESSLNDPVIEKKAMGLPTEVLLEIAKNPEAKEEMLDAVVVRLEEAIE